MNAVRIWSAQIIRVTLAGIVALIVFLQCRDFRAANEVFPTAGFVVFLTFAAFAISWARVNPPISTYAELKRVKRAGLDLLIASGLTLASGALLQLAQDSLLKTTVLASVALLLHVLTLAIGLVLGWFALSTLLRQAVHPSQDSPSEGSV
jgi:SNF family Na+-dependent transporter